MLLFMKLFWEGQQKYLKSSSRGIKYHSMMIRSCLSLASKSAAAYTEIQHIANKSTGLIILPIIKQRLGDYENYIKPQRGFNNEII